MRSPLLPACLAMMLALAAAPAVAQPTDSTVTAPDAPVPEPPPPVDTEPPVIQKDISGPRIGVTFMPNGIAPRTQFGWHHENMAGADRRGPWFLVQQVYLIGGVDQNEFIPSATLIFGVRTPSNFELGIGPSVTLWGPTGPTTAIVAAAGQTLRYGGIRVPINLAVAMSRREGVGSAYRVTLITGWAVKQAPAQTQERYYESRPLGNGGPGR